MVLLDGLPGHQVEAQDGLEILEDGARVEALAGQALRDGAQVVARVGPDPERDGARVEDMAAERDGHQEVMVVEVDGRLVETLEVILEDGATADQVVGRVGKIGDYLESIMTCVQEIAAISLIVIKSICINSCKVSRLRRRLYICK